MSPADAEFGPGGQPVQPGSRQLPLSVAQLVRRSSHALERAIGSVWVEGEVTSLVRATSGHLYFSLKDRHAQVRAVMWRSDAARVRFDLENGVVVRCRGKLGIYERDGKFQLYVQSAELAGVGDEALALEQLRRKLASEGLFELDRKRPLPHLPGRIGVVTSKSGAAVRDIIRAVQRRFPVPILIVDARVQGQSAPRQLVHALQEICRTDVDVIIIGRGGGSASDLAAFNHEQVVRAVAACPVPTISAVGHEIDTSLTDMVADRRAATPTMAGEMAVPVLADMEVMLEKEQHRLHREIELHLATARQELDFLTATIVQGAEAVLAGGGRQIAELRQRLEAVHPRVRLVANRALVRELRSSADSIISRTIERGRHELGSLALRLEAMSPLKVLDRGYALVTADGRIIVDSTAVSVGDPIEVRLARGSLGCRVDRVEEHDQND